MRRRLPKNARDLATAFSTGFILGAAFMASPALGLAIAIIAAIYLAFVFLKG